MASESLAASEIDEVRSEIRKTREKIGNVEDKIQKVETALEGGLAYLGSTDHVWIRNELALLRKEKEQLREKELRLLPAPLPPAASGPTRFVVKATIRGAKSKLGIRAYLYDQAMQQTAYYRQDKEEQAIWYTGDDLHVQLCFMSMEHATAFQTSMANMNTSQFAGLAGTVDVDPSVVPESYAVGTRVWSTDYDSGAFDSPGTTLADLRDKSETSVSFSVIDMGTPLFQYQSLETPILAESYPFERAHIKAKSVCIEAGDKDAVNDSNNMLALSPILHKFFDGNQAHPPAIAIRPGIQGAESIAVNGKDRTRVEVFLECRTKATAEYILRQLKNGTAVERNGDFRTWVHVEDPTKFLQYLRWKYNETKDKWL